MTLSTNYVPEPKYAPSNMKILTPKLMNLDDLRFLTPSKQEMKQMFKKNNNSVAQL